MGASPCPISHFHEPSTTSCKATCLLFRYHLHINAARELVGKHLMEVIAFTDICYPPPSSLIQYLTPLCHKVPLKQYIKGMGMFQATLDKYSEVTFHLG